MTPPSTDVSPVVLCVLLWSRPGHEADLIAYEDRVLALLPEHGAEVLQRARGTEPGDGPLEVHLLRFPSQTALDGYLTDGRRLALQDLRDAAIDRTEIVPVELVA